MERRSFGAPVVDARGSKDARRAFTLVELLVAMAIILILAGMTLAAVNFAATADRIPGGSRQTQSMILGARDRAIYAGEPRGLRLILDPDILNANGKPITASSFVFIGAPQSYGEGRGTVSIEFGDGDDNTATPDAWYVTEDNPRLSAWYRMWQRKLLVGGARITFGNDSRWYTIGTPFQTPSGQVRASLSRGYVSSSGGTVFNGLSYRITLAPSVLPGEEPRLLPQGVVIDLMSSYIYGKIPEGWYTVTADGGDGSADLNTRLVDPATGLNDTVTFGEVAPMDILFNERGVVHGPLASKGVLHLLVADGADVQAGFRIIHGSSGTSDVTLPADGVNDERASPESIITLFTAGGTVVVSPVDETVDATGNARPDPWYLAETGGEA